MADLPEPNFDNISAAITTIGVEVPRIQNLQGIRFSQEILRRLETISVQVRTIQDKQRTIRNELRQINTEQRSSRNDLIRLQNSQRYALNPSTPLLPLRSLRTRRSIPNCPQTLTEVLQLSGPEARRILLELEQPVPGRVAERREAVRQQFFL